MCEEKLEIGKWVSNQGFRNSMAPPRRHTFLQTSTFRTTGHYQTASIVWLFTNLFSLENFGTCCCQEVCLLYLDWDSKLPTNLDKWWQTCRVWHQQHHQHHTTIRYKRFKENRTTCVLRRICKSVRSCCVQPFKTCWRHIFSGSYRSQNTSCTCEAARSTMRGAL